MRSIQLYAVLCIVAGVVLPAFSQDATLINLTPQDSAALVAAVKGKGLAVAVGSVNAKEIRGRLLVLEARSRAEIDPAAADRIGAWIGNGGRFLLTLSDEPGAGPMRLAFCLPTTGWRTQSQAKDAAHKTGGAEIVEFTPEFFTRQSQLALPYFFPTRPFDAVERGEGRYERFARTIPYIDALVAPDNVFWTRPLINRDWQVRARVNDVGHSPVLTTGRYGKGRVAVFGSSVSAAGTNAATFWADVLRWLLADEPAPSHPAAPIHLAPPTCTVDSASRSLDVTVTNPSSQAIDVRVLARLRTWERAIICDVEQPLVVPAGQSAVARLPLPAAGSTAYQACDYRDAFDVRLGILTADGAALLSESTAPVDLRPPLRLSVATDNLQSIAYPFAAAGPQCLVFPHRMGMQIGAYSYLPGQSLNVSVVVENGLRNIAPSAKVQDQTQPDNPSIAALTDDAAFAEQGASPDKVNARGTWVGLAGHENVLDFTFSAPVKITAVTLLGSADNFRQYLTHNPGATIIEADGAEVAKAEDLDHRFVAEAGAVRLSFPPRQAKVVRVRLPWIDRPIAAPDGQRRRGVPWLGEVRIDGVPATVAAQQGVLTVGWRNVITGAIAPIGQQQITAPAGTRTEAKFSTTVPKIGAPAFYRVEAKIGTVEAAAPLLAIHPDHPLQPLADLKPQTAPDMGFIVTRGFRNVFDLGTGTDEIGEGWATPDDLVWAYSRQLKQLGKKASMHADRLYLSDSDMRHYSTPWRDFPNGQYFYDIAPELLVQRMKQDRRWKDSSVVFLSHSDRWDTAPDVDALHGWQDFIGFDEYLRASGQPPLSGRTHKELAEEIHAKYEHPWLAWHLQRYIHALRNLREAFAKEGKRLVITAQGSPLVPADAEAEIAQTLKGQSDDCTWGMVEESVPLTTGRQMGVMAFNPGWSMSTLLQWGFESAVLQNPHWHNPVGTTEPSRRVIYDRAWRGIVGWDGVYRSMHTYAFNTNAGFSYTMTENDWQQFWRVQERHSLIAPDGPIGAGLVISTSRFAKPDQASFSGSGGWGASEADEQVKAVARTVRRLQEAGISIAFTMNAAVLDKLTGNAPLVLLDADLFSESELASLARLKARGVRLAGFTSKGGVVASSGVATLFNFAAALHHGELAGQPVLLSPATLFVSTPAEDMTTVQANAIASPLSKVLAAGIEFPPGTSGYGFTSQGMKFIVVEDWLEQGRVVWLKLRASSANSIAHAADVNDHRTLNVKRQGDDWLIELPLRPGDGTLVAVEEVKP